MPYAVASLKYIIEKWGSALSLTYFYYGNAQNPMVSNSLNSYKWVKMFLEDIKILSGIQNKHS
jgi:hypothetical protein